MLMLAWFGSTRDMGSFPMGRRADGKGSFPLDRDRWWRWYLLETRAAEGLVVLGLMFGSLVDAGRLGMAIVVVPPMPGSDGGGGGRIRIDSALFIRVGDVPGRSKRDARDDLLDGEGNLTPLEP
jgi:hypothetical protein